MEYLLFLGPVILTGLAVFFLHRGLRDSRHTAWHWVGLSFSLFAFICGWLVVMTVSDRSGDLLAFLNSIFASGIAVLSGLWLLFSLSSWRKMMAVIPGVIVPVAFFASLIISIDYSPDAIIRRNGVGVAAALTQYHTNHGLYPTTLTELVPAYLPDLKEPSTIFGWIYKASEDDFALGYVAWVDKFGYNICVYHPDEPKWNCLPNPAEMLPLGPTPVP